MLPILSQCHALLLRSDQTIRHPRVIAKTLYAPIKPVTLNGKSMRSLSAGTGKYDDKGLLLTTISVVGGDGGRPAVILVSTACCDEIIQTRAELVFLFPRV